MGALDGATLSVTSDTIKEDERPQAAAEAAGGGIDQSDKPRAASESIGVSAVNECRYIMNVVAAEYLAKGYTLSDKVLERAIEIDRM